MITVKHNYIYYQNLLTIKIEPTHRKRMLKSKTRTFISTILMIDDRSGIVSSLFANVNQTNY